MILIAFGLFDHQTSSFWTFKPLDPTTFGSSSTNKLNTFKFDFFIRFNDIRFDLTTRFNTIISVFGARSKTILNLV